MRVMEQLYTAFGGFKQSQKDVFVYGPNVIVFEMAVPHIGQEVSFYMAVSKRIQTVVEKQIHGLFPEAQVEKIKDYNIFNPQRRLGRLMHLFYPKAIICLSNL